MAAALGDAVISIEHVGSTSVLGLPAKPIIDIDIVIARTADLPEAIWSLGTIGYLYRGEYGVPGRHAFQAPVGLPEHHSYVCVRGSRELTRHLTFRDHLRTHPDRAQAYGALKQRLAERFGTDRDGYAVAKTAFVEEMLCEAGWCESRHTG
jgi:GrpB-like predicted nucleotidyltransferase (UPF0157 family)